MVKITVGNNTKRSSIVCEGSETIKEILDNNNISYQGTAVSLDGTVLTEDDMDSTLTELGAQNNAYLIAIRKMDNANR